MGGNDTCSWDEAKREKVFRERGIDFDELGRFFLDPGALTVEDKVIAQAALIGWLTR
jgi:uncharacterized DUF497 family protein